ncbi:ubiquinone biosynthesis UbiH/UbiF/VisC/COQ6 family hydroxylase [Neisseria sp. HSC-16F19]|nr:5-demethoxyubiquinol-8 5-hydroxylase UbiM [Neisseria sp. HSC-16F19]MCP2041371.1 ubiquinone biosynthesis UbiH/UbiF/VisC/COQ6 family hydroxylase [Neisseria sp. HSC-16F19]
MSQEATIQTDVVVIGAGPAGLSFARAAAPGGVRITLVERSPESVLAEPPYDGREIALTHKSKELMQHLGMWDRVPENEIYKLKDAKVVNGTSDYQLHFPQPDRARGKPTDTLGYLISNHNIRRSAYEAAKTQDNIRFVCGVGVKEVKTDADKASVTLDDGRQIEAKLLVAADSRFSQTRRQLGISADMHDFGRTVIVVRMRHTLSNNHSAFECFHYGRTLALLPLEEHLTNCVITIDSHRADSILSLNPEELAADLTRQLGGRLGEMTQESEMHTYPLVGVHANAFSAERSALIGDAAVGMHPVTAHGFNLGLESAEILARLVAEAAGKGKDIASPVLLARYQREHMFNTRPLYHGTNMMVKLFTNESPPAKVLRSLVLRLSNNCPPIKQAISRQLTG